jgi:hypothetical protein
MRHESVRKNGAEQCAIEEHRAELSALWERPVSFDEAASDWQTRKATEWRREQLAACLAQQRIEIERYKWIESEKAGHDLGKGAVMEWIAKHAADFRNAYENGGSSPASEEGG